MLTQGMQMVRRGSVRRQRARHRTETRHPEQEPEERVHRNRRRTASRQSQWERRTALPRQTDSGLQLHHRQTGSGHPSSASRQKRAGHPPRGLSRIRLRTASHQSRWERRTARQIRWMLVLPLQKDSRPHLLTALARQIRWMLVLPLQKDSGRRQHCHRQTGLHRP